MKKIKVGNYVHLRSLTEHKLINGTHDILCLVNRVYDSHTSFQSIENNKYFVRYINCTTTEIISVYTKKDIIDLYPEYMI
jgi:hypothetical protein